MDGKAIYRIWAPQEANWVQWVRPVPFTSIKDGFEVHEFCDFKIPRIMYLEKALTDTAVILDCLGNESIREGISLAKLGYRPIPVYNGTDQQKGAMATTDNHSIKIGLIWGATELAKLTMPNDAPPVFLVDTNRLHRYKMKTTMYDNSWDIYGQDLPSAQYLINNGIHKVIVKSIKIEKDLSKILYKFQKNGIEILYTNGFELPQKVIIKKPKEKEEL